MMRLPVARRSDSAARPSSRPRRAICFSRAWRRARGSADAPGRTAHPHAVILSARRGGLGEQPRPALAGAWHAVHTLDSACPRRAAPWSRSGTGPQRWRRRPGRSPGSARRPAAAARTAHGSAPPRPALWRSARRRSPTPQRNRRRRAAAPCAARGTAPSLACLRRAVLSRAGSVELPHEAQSQRGCMLQPYQFQVHRGAAHRKGACSRGALLRVLYCASVWAKPCTLAGGGWAPPLRCGLLCSRPPLPLSCLPRAPGSSKETPQCGDTRQ